MTRRSAVLVAVFVAAVGAAFGPGAGCAEKETAPEGAQAQQGEEADRTEDPGADAGAGVGDFVDYATGKLPIEKGRQIERKVRDIQAEHNRQLEEAMGEE